MLVMIKYISTVSLEGDDGLCYDQTFIMAVMSENVKNLRAAPS